MKKITVVIYDRETNEHHFTRTFEHTNLGNTKIAAFDWAWRVIDPKGRDVHQSDGLLSPLGPEGVYFWTDIDSVAAHLYVLEE